MSCQLPVVSSQKHIEKPDTSNQKPESGFCTLVSGYFHIFCLLFSVLCLLFSASFAFAEEEKKAPVVVNGDKVEYFQDEQKVVGTGNVVVTYEDVELTCDKMIVYLDTKDAFAEGNFEISQEGAIYTGEKGTYNFETKRGEIIKTDMDAPPWYGKGEVVKKVGATEYHVQKGYITSCDYIPPHYKIQSKEIQVFLDDKVVAKNCLMYVGKFPILYLPYYVHPLNEDRPRVTITPGYDSKWGGFVLTSWRYYLHEYIRGYVHLDYRERRDFAWGVDYKYDTRYVGDGLLQTYYMHERTLGTKRLWKEHIPPTEELERYKVQLRHKWEVDPNTDVKVEYHKFNDSTFNKDYFYRNYESDENMPTYISALCQKSLYSAEFRIDKRANHYETVVERLPEFNLDIGQNRFLDTNFYYKSENSISNLDKKYGDDEQEDLDVTRFDTYDEVSYLTKLFGFLSLSPYVGTRQTYFTKDNWGQEDWIRGIFYTGLDTSARFYKLFRYDTNAFGLDINGLRHVINPVVKYYYNHHPTILPRNLMQFDEFDNIDREHGVRFELENKLQTKRKVGGRMKTIDLARLLVTTDYLYKVEQGSEFNDFDAELELRPYRWLYMEAEATYDHLKSKIEKGSWDLVAKDPRGDARWRFGVGQRYELEHTSQFTTEFSYKLTPKWEIRIYERFQGKEKDLKEHEYSIIRDLHCWTVELTYNIYRPAGETVWLVFRTKAFPRSPIRVNTSYHQPKIESQSFEPLD